MSVNISIFELPSGQVVTACLFSLARIIFSKHIFTTFYMSLTLHLFLSWSMCICKSKPARFHDAK